MVFLRKLHLIKKYILITFLFCVELYLVPHIHQFIIRFNELNYAFYIDKVPEKTYGKYGEPIYIYITYEDVQRALEEKDDNLQFYMLKNQDEVVKFIEYMKENDCIITGPAGRYPGVYYVGENSTCEDLIHKFQLEIPPEQRRSNK